jgi:hypothetical protein
MVSKGALHVAALLILGLLGACRSFPMLMHAFRDVFWCGDSGAGARLVHLSAEQSCGMLWAIYCDMACVCGLAGGFMAQACHGRLSKRFAVIPSAAHMALNPVSTMTTAPQMVMPSEGVN